MANYPDIELYIDGRWKRASGQPVINPADESVLGTVPTATTADLDDALAAAERGFTVWRRTSPAKRSQIILKAASLIRERIDDMATAMTLEQGKPIDQARLEILRGCDILEWDATEGQRLYGRVIPSEPGMRHTVLRQPIGPVAAFSPWNFPMSSPSRKVGRRAVVRLLDRPQGLGRNAGRRGTAGAGLSRRRPAAGRAESGVRQSGGDIRLSDPATVHSSHYVHRFDPRREIAGGNGRPPHEAGDHGVGRPRARHRLRRRRPGHRRRGLRRGQVTQRGPGLRFADPVFSSRSRSTSVLPIPSPRRPRS